jgi:hypothetical protein
VIGTTQLAGLAGLFRLNPYRAALSVKCKQWNNRQKRNAHSFLVLVWQVRQMAVLISVCKGVQGFLGSGKSGKGLASPATSPASDSLS